MKNKGKPTIINAQTIVQRKQKTTEELITNSTESTESNNIKIRSEQSVWQKRLKNISSSIYILFLFILFLTVLPNILTHYTFAFWLLFFIGIGTTYDHEIFRNFYLLIAWFIYENIFNEECSVPVRIGCDYLNGSVELSQLFWVFYLSVSFFLYVLRLRSLSTVLEDLKYYITFLFIIPKFCNQILEKLILPTLRCLFCCWCCRGRDRFIIKKIETSIDSNVVQIKEL